LTFLEIANKYWLSELPLSFELLAKVIYSVIPVEAGIQNCSKILDSGRPLFARNDDFLSFSRVLQEALLSFTMIGRCFQEIREKV